MLQEPFIDKFDIDQRFDRITKPIDQSRWIRILISLKVNMNWLAKVYKGHPVGPYKSFLGLLPTEFDGLR